MVKFRQFLCALGSKKSAVGDFMATIQSDKSFPNPETWNELRRYLIHAGASHETMVGFRMVWRRYKDEQRGRSAIPARTGRRS